MLVTAAPTLACAGLGALHGSVRDSATAAAVPDAVVTASSPSCTETVRTDQDGSFIIAGVPFGRYTITLSKSGYENTSLAIKIAGDRVATQADITMSRAIRVIAHVRDWHPYQLVSPNVTADKYVPLWLFASPFGSAFNLLPFVPGLTFGNAPRMMR